VPAQIVSCEEIYRGGVGVSHGGGPAAPAAAAAPARLTVDGAGGAPCSVQFLFVQLSARLVVAFGAAATAAAKSTQRANATNVDTVARSARGVLSGAA
jgi:hypothetical protein